MEEIVKKPRIIRIRVDEDECVGCIGRRDGYICVNLPPCFNGRPGVERLQYIFKYKETPDESS